MSVFEVLTKFDDTANRNATRAAIAAQERVRARFGRFVANASDESEAGTRRALVDDEIRSIAAEVAEEYDGDAEHAYLAATAVLGGGHASDCSCGFCENKGKLPGSDKDPLDEKDDDKLDGYAKEQDNQGKSFESSVKTACEGCGCGSEKCNCTKDSPCGKDGCKYSKKEASWAVVAAEPNTGDNYQQERVSLPTADASGLGSEGSPKIDKGNSGDVAGWSLSDIDVGSKKHRLDKQDVTEPADYNDPDFTRDLDSPIHEDADVTKSVGPPNTDGTKTWTGTGGQADPVTSESLNQVAARYQIVSTEE